MKKILDKAGIFCKETSGSALETLHLAAAYCTAYAEDFVSGDQASGSYRCSFTLADPDGWTLAAGGPTGTVAGLPPAGGGG